MGVNGTAKKFKVKKIVKHAVREYITIVDAEDAHLLRSYYWTVVTMKAKYTSTSVAPSKVIRFFCIA